ncbi:MAG: hypothetical protein GY716_11950 [bacterium]|nr:hypothetical protein [bacterium]
MPPFTNLRRASTGRCVACAVLLATAFLVGSSAHAGKKAAPYALHLEVDWGQPVGPERLRDQVEDDLVFALRVAACVASVDLSAPAQPGPNDRVLRVRIDNLIDETEFEVSIAERSSPTAMPDTARRFAAHLGADFGFALISPEGEVLSSKRFRVDRSHRPVLDEDPHYEVERKLVEEAVRLGRVWTCKTGGKLAKQAGRTSKRGS